MFKTTRLLCTWNSPGKNTGVGSHSLLKGMNLPDLGIKPRSPDSKEIKAVNPKGNQP